MRGQMSWNLQIPIFFNFRSVFSPTPDKFTNFCSFPGNLAYFIEGYIDSIKKNSEKQIHVGKKHTKKEYPTNCIEDILFGFFSLFI